jgi:myosin heavy subunit
MHRSLQALAVDAAKLRPAITTDINHIRGEAITKALSTEQSADNRDAAAKALYGRLFTWLVNELSKLIAPSAPDSSPSLSLLDIFGFENFEVGFLVLRVSIPCIFPLIAPLLTRSCCRKIRSSSSVSI